VKSVKRRIAAVTGGFGGIGGGIVQALTKVGFDVVVCGRAFHPERFNALKSSAAADATLAFATGDLADLADHPRLVSEIFDAFGRLDCLVNNAGVSVKVRGDMLEVSPESFDLNFAVNTRGTFFITQAICKRMLADEASGQESARSIIFISSANAAIAAPERGEYAMSKAAVAMMAKLFAVRLAPSGIAVYEVRPGLIKTPMTAVASERFERLLAEGFTPINRWGMPDDVGRAVATMAAGDLPFTTGAVIQVDGGLHIHHY
jgi:3-oxoacyl-[acyl-carrier protein] reductase